MSRAQPPDVPPSDLMHLVTAPARPASVPFDVRLPNAETVEALEQAETGEGLIECPGGLEELRARFG